MRDEVFRNIANAPKEEIIEILFNSPYSIPINAMTVIKNRGLATSTIDGSWEINFEPLNGVKLVRTICIKNKTVVDTYTPETGMQVDNLKKGINIDKKITAIREKAVDVESKKHAYNKVVEALEGVDDGTLLPEASALLEKYRANLSDLQSASSEIERKVSLLEEVKTFL